MNIFKRKAKQDLFFTTTKHQIAEIMFNFAMRICTDNEEEAVRLINTERKIIGNKPKRDLLFWKSWISEPKEVQ